MKAFLLSAVVALVSTSAHAILPGPDIRTAQVDAQMNQRFGNVAGGDIQINLSHKEVSFSYVNALPKCTNANPKACLVARPIAVQIDLPLISVKRGTCGQIVYTASRTNTFGHGSRETIVVRDSKNNTCDIGVLAPTLIEYTYEYAVPGHGVITDRTFLTARELIQIKY